MSDSSTLVTLWKLPTSQSDRIYIRRGFDGDEDPDFIASLPKPVGPSSYRLTIAVNTCYPEVFGGYYFNRRILKVIGETVESFGMLFCIWDLHSGNFIPVEEPVSLNENEEYALVGAAAKTLGGLLIWYSTGGEGSFYNDKMILDFRLPLNLSDRLEEGLKGACLRAQIAVERFPDAPYKEPPTIGSLVRMWRPIRRFFSW